MRQVLGLTALFFCLACHSQEIPTLHADQHAVPDAVVYRILMHHAAAFSAKAQEMDAQGLDGNPYRKHFEQKFGLSPSQVRLLMQVAADYSFQVQPYEQQSQAMAKKFKEDHFPGGKLRAGESLPAPPVELKEIRKSRDALALQARDRLKTAMGDSEFARLDAAIRRAFHAPSDLIAPAN